jgi:hypothetical protein
MRYLGDFAAMGTVGAIAADGVALPTGLADLSMGGLLITLVAFMILSVFRGWIVVKLHYDTLLARCTAAEAAVTRLTETNAVQARTIEKQTAVGDTVVRVMNSVQQARTAEESTP